MTERIRDRRVTRRQLLKSGSLGATGLALTACGGGDNPNPLAPPATAGGVQAGNAQLPPFEFTGQERKALTAALARIIPALGPDDWSAADAGAVDYIENLLNAFSRGGAARVYPGGPERVNFTRFVPLNQAKSIGWQDEILRLRRVYRDGLAELDRRARGPLSLLPGDFASLLGLVQDAILTVLDLAGTEFFAALYDHTMEGVYSHPVYGGNKDYIGWNSVCYQGDVHGVRFPSGAQDPTADDRPWDKFGGYSPEEMIQPGQCPGQGPTRSMDKTSVKS